MTAYVLLLITTYVLTLPALALFIFFGILFEANDNSSSIVCAIIAGVVAFFVFSLSITDMILIVAAYVIIGSVWSFWRYRHFVTEKVANWNTKVNMSAQETKWFVESLTPRACLNRITCWIIVWPFSMVENIAGDLIRMIKHMITNTFKSVYNKIYTKAIANLTVNQGN
jgi:hypothetical protein